MRIERKSNAFFILRVLVWLIHWVLGWLASKQKRGTFICRFSEELHFPNNPTRWQKPRAHATSIIAVGIVCWKVWSIQNTLPALMLDDILSNSSAHSWAYFISDSFKSLHCGCKYRPFSDTPPWIVEKSARGARLGHEDLICYSVDCCLDLRRSCYQSCWASQPCLCLTLCYASFLFWAAKIYQMFS